MTRNIKIILILAIFSLVLPVVAQRTRYFNRRVTPARRRVAPAVSRRPLARHAPYMNRRQRVMEEEQMGTMADISEMDDIGV